MKPTFLIASFLFGLAGGIIGNVLFSDEPKFGATTARTTITNPWTFSATTTFNANIDVTTTNTATSTAKYGCWQTTATSTATPIKVQATTTGQPLIPVFGTCPRI